MNTPRTPSPPDRDKIWTNCAECMYKHLSAAYALLTATTQTIRPVAQDDVLRERAIILFTEHTLGYKGNLDLAYGCLAAIAGQTQLIQLARKALLNGTDLDTLIGNLRGDEIGDYAGDPVLVAAAHIEEALRERPIGYDDPSINMLHPDLFFTHDRLEILTVLAYHIWRVRSLFELRKGKDESDQSGVPCATEGSAYPTAGQDNTLLMP